MEAPTESRGVELDLTDVAFGGDALGRLDGEVVFVPYGLPGERVRAEIKTQKRDFVSAEILEILRPSEARVVPRCPHFGACGGCNWQQAAYEAQLAMKRQVVVDQLVRIGGFREAAELVREPIGMVSPWEYRNHARFSLGRKWGDVGYTYRASHRLLRVDYCAITHPAINAVLETIQRRCAGIRSHQIVVRYGSNTGSLLVNPALPMIPELDTGQLSLEEEILDRCFRVSAASFFQVNTRREARELPESISSRWTEARSGYFSLADLLALLVLDRLDPTPDDTVADAYCGVGTFTSLIAPHARKVIGVEESPAATKDAARNTEDLPNVEFRTGRTEAVLPALAEEGLDAVVLDPSRVGCAPEVVQALISSRPRKIVYVSCDPATLARDLKLLAEGGYQIEGVEPVDMFPQTYHIESVTTLSR